MGRGKLAFKGLSFAINRLRLAVTECDMLMKNPAMCCASWLVPTPGFCRGYSESPRALPGPCTPAHRVAARACLQAGQLRWVVSYLPTGPAFILSMHTYKVVLSYLIKTGVVACVRGTARLPELRAGHVLDAAR